MLNLLVVWLILILWTIMSFETDWCNIFLFGCAEEEKKFGLFSPQFGHHSSGSLPGEELDVPSNSLRLPTHSQTKLGYDSCFSLGNFPEAIAHSVDNVKIMPSSPLSISEGTANAAIKSCNLIRTGLGRGIQKQASVADLLCAECKKLLFRPVVLNCGHGNL